jgi:hypothetical protein
MERRGKGQAARETERESVCERWSVAKNRVSVRHKMAVGRRISYFEISGNPNVRIMFFMRNYFNGEERLRKIH